MKERAKKRWRGEETVMNKDEYNKNIEAANKLVEEYEEWKKPLVEDFTEIKPYVVNEVTLNVQLEPTGEPNQFTDGKYIFNIYPPGEGGELVDIDEEFGYSQIECEGCDRGECEFGYSEEIPYTDNGDGIISFSLGQVEDSEEARKNFMNELLGNNPSEPEPVDEDIYSALQINGWIHGGEEVVRWNQKPSITQEQLKDMGIYYATNAYDPNWLDLEVKENNKEPQKTFQQLVQEHMKELLELEQESKARSRFIEQRLKRAKERQEKIDNIVKAVLPAEEATKRINKKEEGK
jgi:hypothetical protein